MKISFFSLPYQLENFSFHPQDVSSLLRYLGYNSGNLLFRHGAYSFFDGEFAEDLADPESDLIILPLANQIGLHESAIKTCIFLNDKLSETKAPIIALGLGSQVESVFYKDLDPNIVAFIRLLSNRCKTIHVRDENTKRLIGLLDMHNVVVSGCPSFFLNRSQDLGRQIMIKLNYPKFNINTTYQSFNDPLTPHLFGLKKFSHEKFSIIIQENQDNEITNFLLKRPIYSKDLDPCFHFFYNLRDWKNHVKHFDLHIGTRIHNSIMNILCGNVSICITHDARTLNLCKTLHIPYIPKERFMNISEDFNQILSEINFDDKKFDDNRSILLESFVQEIRCHLPDYRLLFNLKIPELNLNHFPESALLLQYTNINVLKTKLPHDFSASSYLHLNPDLECFREEKDLILHYLRYGRHEQRRY